ncbi:MAG: hypothetical protein QW735_00995 [archaeon]
MKEIWRNIIHLCVGYSIAFLALILNPFELLLILSLGILFGMLLSEICSERKILGISKILEILEREKVKPGEGAIYYLLGCFFAVAFFPKSIYFIGILTLAVEDSFSTVFGKYFGKTKIWKDKSLEGTVAGFISCFFILSLFIPIHTSLLISLIISLVEVFAPINDNLIIPFATCLILKMVGG